MIRLEPSTLIDVRRILSEEIEVMIGILDDLDGDPDEEASEADEASLSLGEWTEAVPNANSFSPATACTEQLRPPVRDLAYCARPGGVLGFYGNRDLEELEQDGGDMLDDDAGDDREMDEDREPILGWTEGLNQGAVSARYGDSWVWDEDEQ